MYQPKTNTSPPRCTNLNALADALASCGALAHLDVSYNALSQYGVQHLAARLYTCPALRVLNLPMCVCASFTHSLADGVARWMRAADLLCMTSRNVGLPNVILEAQACGLPVLSTAVGGLHEVVDEPWKGTLTPMNDMPAWETAARHLIENPLDRERIAALGSIRTWDATAAAYQRVIEDH